MGAAIVSASKLSRTTPTAEASPSRSQSHAFPVAGAKKACTTPSEPTLATLQGSEARCGQSRPVNSTDAILGVSLEKSVLSPSRVQSCPSVIGVTSTLDALKSMGFEPVGTSRARRTSSPGAARSGMRCFPPALIASMSAPRSSISPPVSSVPDSMSRSKASVPSTARKRRVTGLSGIRSGSSTATGDFAFTVRRQDRTEVPSIGLPSTSIDCTRYDISTSMGSEFPDSRPTVSFTRIVSVFFILSFFDIGFYR